MKIIKSTLGITGIAVFAFLVVGAGLLSYPAQAAGEPAARLEPNPFDAENGAVCTPDTDGMVAYWPFDDGLAQLEDVIQNPAFNNGTCTDPDCPTSNLSGKVAAAVTFDGADEVRVADTSGLDFTVAGDMTIEAWVKTSQDCTARAVFVGRYEGSNSAAWWLGCVEDNVAGFHMRDSLNQTFTVKGTKIINDGQWHHIVGTRDGTANINKIYVDGAMENSSTPAFTGELTFTAKNVTIGFFDPSPYYWFNGSLDETALYDQALTAEDVARHYLGGQGQSYCNVNPPTANGVTFQAQKNTPLNFTKAKLLENDVAPDGGLDLVSYTSPSTEGGTITGSDPYTYTPPTDFVGTDTFSYKITDKFGKQADGVATVEVKEGAVPSKEVYLPLVFKN
jgi:hypothetical protein